MAFEIIHYYFFAKTSLCSRVLFSQALKFVLQFANVKKTTNLLTYFQIKCLFSSNKFGCPPIAVICLKTQKSLNVANCSEDVKLL